MLQVMPASGVLNYAAQGLLATTAHRIAQLTESDSFRTELLSTAQMTGHELGWPFVTTAMYLHCDAEAAAGVLEKAMQGY